MSENKIITIYHGSDHIIEKPYFGGGSKDCDYGQGFYTTQDIEKARMWAVGFGSNDAICNEYQIDISDLNILDLTKYGIISWAAEIIANRGTKFESSSKVGQILMEYYKVDTSNADIIIGYRADDSYSDIIDSFLDSKLTIYEVGNLFKKGNLGFQVFIKSKKAFEKIKFIGYERVEKKEEYLDFDKKAREEVSNFLEKRNVEINAEGYKPNGIIISTATSYKVNYDYENNRYSYDVNVPIR